MDTNSFKTSLKNYSQQISFVVKNYFNQTEVNRDKNLLILSGLYIILLTVFHWGLHPDLGIIFFVLGGIFGIYFLDLAEKIFAGKIKDVGDLGNVGGLGGMEKKSPFKNVLLQVIYLPLILFILTSSGSLFGTGLVLTSFLGILYNQYQEYRQTGKIESYFWVIKTPIEASNQKIFLLVMVGGFGLLSLLFI